MNTALNTYLFAVRAGKSHDEAVVLAAEACAHDPWMVVASAGLLARCRVEKATALFGLTNDLKRVSVNSRREKFIVEEGQPYPVIDRSRRRKSGAFDTGRQMASDLVRQALAHGAGTPQSGLDAACGTGAFLLAMAEAGIPTIYGEDLDELSLRVANVAVPKARLSVGDALMAGPRVDLVVGNPPFVPPERQSRAVRRQARERFPWLSGRFDLVVPFAASAVERCNKNAITALVLPSSMLTQPYGATLRREWLRRHRVLHVSSPQAFAGASVFVSTVVLKAEGGQGPWPTGELKAQDLLELPNVPFHTSICREDIDLVKRIRSASCHLGELCLVDTGVVAHSPGGSKHELIRRQYHEGCVPYADAKGFFAGELAWLDYRPERMHRAKQPSMFEKPKIVVQRLRGQRPIRAKVDRSGVYLGHTCTIVQPKAKECPNIDRLAELVGSPIVDAVTRIERGARLDLYPKDVKAFPVPSTWLTDDSVPLDEAFGLNAAEVERLRRITTQL